MFRKYAEKIGFASNSEQEFDVEKTDSESIRLLSDIAKEHKIWLIGGAVLDSRLS